MTPALLAMITTWAVFVHNVYCVFVGCETLSDGSLIVLTRLGDREVRFSARLDSAGWLIGELADDSDPSARG